MYSSFLFCFQPWLQKKMVKIHYSSKQKLVSSKNYEILLKMPLYVNPFDCYACKINYLVESNINSRQLGFFQFHSDLLRENYFWILVMLSAFADFSQSFLRQLPSLFEVLNDKLNSFPHHLLLFMAVYIITFNKVWIILNLRENIEKMSIDEQIYWNEALKLGKQFTVVKNLLNRFWRNSPSKSLSSHLLHLVTLILVLQQRKFSNIKTINSGEFIKV